MRSDVVDHDGPATPTSDLELQAARTWTHQVERYTWLMRARAATPEAEGHAKRVHSLAVGLRRMLDKFGGLTDG